jgi:hypothetical protein
MPRHWSAVTLVLVVILGLFALGRSPGTHAQDATPIAAPGHPIVGAWIQELDPSNPAVMPELIMFFSDGTMLNKDAEGAINFGVWEASGDSSVNLTLVSTAPGETVGMEAAVIFVVRAELEVAADGQSFTGTYTFEITTTTGEATGQYGPGTITANRLAVEPMGEPIGTFEDLFGGLEGGAEGTPEE